MEGSERQVNFTADITCTFYQCTTLATIHVYCKSWLLSAYFMTLLVKAVPATYTWTLRRWVTKTDGRGCTGNANGRESNQEV